MTKYILYQIKNDPSVPHGIKFSGLEDLKKFGLLDKLTLNIYIPVYHGTIENGKPEEQLEKIYSRFQGIKPEGYRGHSISVSDVIFIKGNFYFCDRICWKKINF